MPNRMLRDWTCSTKVKSLSVHAERFFTRLIMKVDDYGCFYADTSLLKANLFPLLLDTIREADLLRWMAECQKAGLIVLYENSGKKYVQILDFKQRLDKAKSKFPLPTSTDFPESVNEFPAEVEVEVETEKENEVETEMAGADENFYKNKKSEKNSPGPGVEFPFGENFLSLWSQWKVYKQTQFHFQYKSPHSEQAAINDLVRLSSGIETNAVEIIHQSMAKGWKGFFELKNSNNGKQSVISNSSLFSRISKMPDEAGK